MKATSQSNRDVLVIGGGTIGLAIALELRSRGATVTVVGRKPQEAASQAAAGMLAPQAERLVGPELELALASRSLYPEWVAQIERQSNCVAGYWPCGILAPAGAATGDPGPPPAGPPAVWLDRPALDATQTGLGSTVTGGWWYPEDAQVDNRALWQALRQACLAAGVEIEFGTEVLGLCQEDRQAIAARTGQGLLQARSFVVASGAWAAQMLPLPVFPIKGQMLSLRAPGPMPLRRVLFDADKIYLVPRQDGRLIVGATVETVGWQTGNTPAGLEHLLAGAQRLYPEVRDWKLEEIWWGYRPGTPDGAPILGPGPCKNVFVAAGHGRNGILLAPITARILADLVESEREHPLLAHFSGDRFLQPRPPASTFIDCTPKESTMPAPNDCPDSDIPNNASNGNGSARDANGRDRRAEPAITQAARAKNAEVTAEPASVPGTEPLVIAGREFRSRLMTGSGKYSDLEVMQQSLAASACDIVTVAVRRVQTKAPGHEGLATAIDWDRYWMLPNTAGCKTAEEAVRVARLGREMAKLLGQEDNNFVKLEVIPDSKYLLPDPVGTLQAADRLVKEGFAVLPYINADPLLAKRLEEMGCATVMPLGSPIGSGQGIRNAANIEIIIAEAKIPVVVDAGIGTPSEAAYAMELGADALLINSAIALARNPVQMALAMRLAAEAGHLARQAGRIPVKATASPSSPVTGTISS